MSGKIVSGIICLLLLSWGVSPILNPPNYYDINGAEDPAVMALAKPATIKRAEAYAEMMRVQDLDGLRRESAPSILNDDFYKAVPQIAGYSTAEKPKAVRILGYHINTTTSTSGGQWSDSNIVIVHYYPFGVIVTTTWFHDENKVSKVTGFNLRRLSNADIESLKFNLAGKTPVHYAILAVAAFILVFSLVTLYIACTRPGLKLRWLWIPFVALGIGHFIFNWGDTTMAFDLANFSAPQARFDQALFEPAKIHFWLPIGAVLFWLFAQKVAPKAEVKHPEF